MFTQFVPAMWHLKRYTVYTCTDVSLVSSLECIEGCGVVPMFNTICDYDGMFARIWRHGVARLLYSLFFPSRDNICEDSLIEYIRVVHAHMWAGMLSWGRVFVGAFRNCR